MVDLGLAQEVLDAPNADDVVSLCHANPELLDPAFAEALLEAERDLAAEYSADDLAGLTYARLTLDSIREGRNLRASKDAFGATTSLRVMRDLLIAEPLLLHPLFPRLSERLEIASRHQGDEVGASSSRAYRLFLIDAAQRGVDNAFFDRLVLELTRGSSSEAARTQNADLAAEFAAWVHAQAGDAVRVGNHDKVQLLLAAGMTLRATPATELPMEDLAVLERIQRLSFIVLGSSDPADWREQLEEEPELLADGAARTVSSSLEPELMRASLERDVLAARDHWRRRGLLLRCAEVGVATAYDEWERGAWWPALVATR